MVRATSVSRTALLLSLTMGGLAFSPCRILGDTPSTTPTPVATRRPSSPPPTPSLSEIARARRPTPSSAPAPKFRFYALRTSLSNLGEVTVSGMVENVGTRTACQVLVSFHVYSSARQYLVSGEATPDPTNISPDHHSPFSGTVSLPPGALLERGFLLGAPSAQVASYSRGCDS